ADAPALPAGQSAVVDRRRAGDRVRVADLRPVERERLAAGDHRAGGDDPLGRVAVLEVRVTEAAGELVRTPGRVRRVVDGVAAVAVDDLREGVPVAVVDVRPRAV